MFLLDNIDLESSKRWIGRFIGRPTSQQKIYLPKFDWLNDVLKDLEKKNLKFHSLRENPEGKGWIVYYTEKLWKK